MKTAFISDLHGNLEAVSAVMADIESREADRVMCLGDVVNYGPDPVKCLRIVRKLELVLLGNHEEAVLHGPVGMNAVAAEAAGWTRSVLEPGFFSDGAKWANWQFIQGLPARHDEDSIVLVHGSPRAPTNEYLLPFDAEHTLGEPSARLKESFDMIERFCFVGHTHLPGVFMEQGVFATPAELDGELRIPKDGKLIVNVGSVGQPRDRDRRACYATFDGDVLRYHRVEYDAETTCAKVKAAKGLPDWCGDRLLTGE